MRGDFIFLRVELIPLGIAIQKSGAAELIAPLIGRITTDHHILWVVIGFSIVENGPLWLKENGTLWVVGRHNKGGSALKRKMEEVFRNVSEVAKKSGYRVYVARKLSPKP